MAQKDERDYAQWSRRALALLEVGEVPSWKEAGTDDVRKGLLGKTRAFTLRLRVWTWEAFVRWLQWRRGRAWPSSQANVIDFVMEKMRDRPAAYFPRSVLTALHWFESRSGLPLDNKIGKSETLKFILEKAEQ